MTESLVATDAPQLLAALLLDEEEGREMLDVLRPEVVTQTRAAYDALYRAPQALPVAVLHGLAAVTADHQDSETLSRWHRAQGADAALDRMDLRLGAENDDIVGPFHRCEAGGERVVIAVGDEDRNAQTFQTRAAVAQGQLRFYAVLFLIVDIAGQDEKIRFFPLAATDEALKRDEGGVVEKAGETAALARFLGKPPEGGIQMQICRVDVADFVHAAPRCAKKETEALFLDFF